MYTALWHKFSASNGTFIIKNYIDKSGKVFKSSIDGKNFKKF